MVSFRCEEIFLDDRNPQTWRFERLREAHIGWRTPERHTKRGDGQLGQSRSLQNTKSAFQKENPIRLPNERNEDFRFGIGLGKTLVGLNNDEHAPMRPAISDVKTGFCLLQESSFRFLRN